MFLESHRSSDGRFSLGFDPPSILLFDRAAPHGQPIRVWPYDDGHYREAIAYTSSIGGEVVELPPPEQRAPQPAHYPPAQRRSRWTNWFLAPIIGGAIGLVLWFAQADNSKVCQTDVGIFARAASSTFNHQCEYDIAIHRLGLILMIGAAVWAGVLLFRRRNIA